jgi:hypothetical protein
MFRLRQPPLSFHLISIFPRRVSPMKKIVALSLIAAASLSLAACSKGAENEAAADANATATDLNATADAAVADVNAAAGEALNAADAALENAGAATEATAENATNAM